MVRLRTGEGDVLDKELRRTPMPLCCWAKVKELRRGARGVAVGVVEAEEATEFLRLLPLMGDETMDLVIMLHRGDMAASKIEEEIEKRPELLNNLKLCCKVISI